MTKKILFALTLFSILFLGSISILPGLTIRNISVVGLLLYALLNAKEVSFNTDEKSYLVFITVLLLCNILNGQIASFGFVQNFVVYHLACVVIIMTIPLFVKNLRDLSFVTKLLIAFYIINVIVSYWQFFNNPLGWDLAYLITPGFEDNIEERMHYLEDLDDLSSYAITPGINGFVVTNGYFVATFLPVVSCMALNRGSRSFWGLVVLAVGVFGLYMIQQRSAFFLGVLYVFIALCYRMKSDWLTTSILLLAAVVVVTYFGTEFMQMDLGRLVLDDVATDDRFNLLHFFYEFMNEPTFILGGEDDPYWLSTLGHNTIFSSLLQGGIMSMLAYIVAFIIIVKRCLQLIFISYKNGFINTFVYSVACIIFIAISLTHSLGIQSGAIMFWLCYVLMIQAHSFEVGNRRKHNVF